MFNFRRRSIYAVAIGLSAALVVHCKFARAVDFGWQELPGGGIEYLVQVEPAMLETFKQGGFASEIPAGLRDVRRISIVVGDEKLPNQGNIDGPKASQTALSATDSRATSEGTKKDTTSSTTQPSDASKIADDNASSPSQPATFGTPEPTPDIPKPTAPGLLNPGDLIKAIPFLQPGRTQSSTTTVPQAKSGENHDANRQLPSQAQTIGANSAAEKLPPPEMPAESHSLAGSDPAAGYMAISAARPETPATTTTDNTPKPWLPLILALLGLFLSLGANVYLGWIHQALRLRYRSLAHRQSAEVATIV